MMFRSNTQSVTIAADPLRLHAFLSNPEELPRWAPGFAPAVRRDGEAVWIAREGAEIELRILGEAKSGVVDYETRTPSGEWSSARSRVVPNGTGSEYVFTLFQLPGMPDDAFEAMVAGMGHELEVLRSLMEI